MHFTNTSGLIHRKRQPSSPAAASPNSPEHRRCRSSRLQPTSPSPSRGLCAASPPRRNATLDHPCRLPRSLRDHPGRWPPPQRAAAAASASLWPPKVCSGRADLASSPSRRRRPGPPLLPPFGLLQLPAVAPELPPAAVAAAALGTRAGSRAGSVGSAVVAAAPRRQLRLRSAVLAVSTPWSLFGCCFWIACVVPAIRGCSDASRGEHGDRWSVMITVLTSLWINSARLALFGATFPDCALFAEPSGCSRASHSEPLILWKLRGFCAIVHLVATVGSACVCVVTSGLIVHDPIAFAEIEKSILARFSAKLAERTRFWFGFLPMCDGGFRCQNRHFREPGFVQLSGDNCVVTLELVPDEVGHRRVEAELAEALQTLELGQAEKEFKVEVEVIGKVRHKNLVGLIGYCAEGTKRMLVYEYIDNGNLEQWLLFE
uniref:Serine-threonine/tyrosine-protein kinase catalytic domain-containing protein n=1 Tax=Ananas comosus var. bracteatus TaxID=296719 RepID=A0A6V7PHQ8_ANACO|nr:unnamed protein product [Ananas comosus var. bracteatus]